MLRRGTILTAYQASRLAERLVDGAHAAGAELIDQRILGQRQLAGVAFQGGVGLKARQQVLRDQELGQFGLSFLGKPSRERLDGVEVIGLDQVALAQVGHEVRAWAKRGECHGRASVQGKGEKGTHKA